MERDDHEELIRCRERLHSLEATTLGLRFLLDDLREWRAQARLQLDGLVKAEEIADAVAAKMTQERTLHLTVVQKGAAFVLGAATFADLIRGLV